MKLNYDVASFVFDEISQMIKLPIYITNAAGEIVSGTNRQMAGTILPEALDAISTNGSAVLAGDGASGLTGLACPICYQGKCIGAAVVIGEPSAYEPYLYILKFAIEVLIERSIHTRQGVYRRQMIESWIANLFNPDYKDWDELERTAAALGIDTSTASTVVVLHIARKTNTVSAPVYQDPSFVENFILQNISNLMRINFYSYLGRNLYAFSFALNPATRIRLRSGFKSELYETLSILSTRLTQVNMSCLAGVGETGNNLKMYRRSFLQAKKSVELSRRLPGDHPVMHAYDWGIMYFLSLIPKNQIDELYAQYFSKVKNLKPELIETAETFFKNNCAIQKTAEAMNVHKNTLLYRFKRLKELCGLDPQNFQDAIVLQLLFLVGKLYPGLLKQVIDPEA